MPKKEEQTWAGKTGRGRLTPDVPLLSLWTDDPVPSGELWRGVERGGNGTRAAPEKSRSNNGAWEALVWGKNRGQESEEKCVTAHWAGGQEGTKLRIGMEREGLKYEMSWGKMCGR